MNRVLDLYLHAYDRERALCDWFYQHNYEAVKKAAQEKKKLRKGKKPDHAERGSNDKI